MRLGAGQENVYSRRDRKMYNTEEIFERCILCKFSRLLFNNNVIPICITLHRSKFNQ